MKNGYFGMVNEFGYVDEHGNQVQRTKFSHPYSYDGFVQERVMENSESTGSVYTDRLLKWDYKLTRSLMKKHFKDTGIDQGGDYWDKRSAKAIQGFLRERLSSPTLKVTLVMEYCNVSNGYPVWRIDYKINNEVFL
jgi:hypothetical protein